MHCHKKLLKNRYFKNIMKQYEKRFNSKIPLNPVR